MPTRSPVRVILVALLTFGIGCSLQATTEDVNSHRTSRSTDAHERVIPIESAALTDAGRRGNPHESSFGTVQQDGTYCGVFCSENH